MANSDNVLRGGLTSKHIDVDELMRVVRFEAEEPTLLPVEAVGARTYHPGTGVQRMAHRPGRGARTHPGERRTHRAGPRGKRPHHGRRGEARPEPRRVRTALSRRLPDRRGHRGAVRVGPGHLSRTA